MVAGGPAAGRDYPKDANDTSFPGDSTMSILRIVESFFSVRNFLVAAFLAAATAPASFAETVAYSYDSMNRLTKAQYAGGTVISYVYDAMGNRLVKSLYKSGLPANSPPNQASLLSPAPGTVVGSSLTMQWSGSDPNPGDRLSYDLYLGTDGTTLRKVWSGAQTSFAPWNLPAGTIYYWKVVTRDSQNSETAGPVWNFTTGGSIANLPPLSLSVALLGTGGGTVTSNPAGIACTGAPADACGSDFSNGSAVTLMAVNGGSSRLQGWSIASCALNPSCVVTMDSDLRVTASFALVPPIQTSYPSYPMNPPAEYSSFAQLAPMLTFMPFPCLLKSHNRLFTENVVLDGPASPILAIDWKGGYSGDYSTVTGTSRIAGTVTIKNAIVTVDRIVIQ